ALYFFGARLVGTPAAAAAALLLTLNVVQVWFSRYPNADMVMQALLFAALLGTARSHVDDDPFFAPIAGALFAVLLFLRFDAVVAVGASVAGLLLGYVAGHRLRWTFFAPLAAGAVLLVLARADARVLRAAAHLPLAPARVAVCDAGSGGDGARRRGDRRPPFGARVADGRPAAAAGAGRGGGAAGRLRVRVPPSWRQADRLRRLRAADVRGFLRHRAGVDGRGAGLRDGRPRPVLARPRVPGDVHGLRLLLLLQDPDRPGALLDGAPLRARHPARHAAA